ncbi:MAG: CDP-diacylglycerol--glycerol-3-phosphate 3-phosphatidyltransferase [Verrucomicrobiota bacterium]
MNLPNQLTVARLILTIIFVGVLSSSMPHAATIGAILFIIAALTDMLDGILARKMGLITDFGKLMDPLADKVLMCSAFVLLVELDQLRAWVVAIILTREFLVTGLRLLATSKGLVLAADSLGKWKTIFQMVTAVYLLVFLAAQENGLFGFLKPAYETSILGPKLMSPVLVGLTLFFTVVSGIAYLLKNLEVLRASENSPSH